MTRPKKPATKESKDVRASLWSRPFAAWFGLPLHTRILLGLVVGVVAGVTVNQLLGADNQAVKWVVRNLTEPIGTVFLRLLLMIVVPLVFSSLIVGVAGIGDIRRLGRVGLKCFGYTLIFSGLSVIIGLTLANVIKPGQRMPAETRQALTQQFQSDATKFKKADEERRDVVQDSPLMQAVKTIVPSNPVASVAGEPPHWAPNMLHLMFFALLIGVAATLLQRETIAPFLDTMQGLYELTAKIIDLIMGFAPYAVACLLFNTTARFGLDLLGALAVFMITVLLGLGLQMFVVYSLSVYWLSRISPWEFFRRIKTVMLTAFSTSSSNATLPTALRVSEEELGVPREISSFVLTVGATANQNGTALYEGVTVLFIAQLAGIELTLTQQLWLVLMAILGGVGTAGVPSGSIPFIVGVLAGIGIDPTLIAVILGVDRLLDMCRTTLNVTGDLTIATYVARSEGFPLFGEKGSAAPLASDA